MAMGYRPSCGVTMSKDLFMKPVGVRETFSDLEYQEELSPGGANGVKTRSGGFVSTCHRQSGECPVR